jgi:hypothetical protein
MLPFLDDTKRIDNVLGSTVVEMLQNSVSMLSDPTVATNPDGRYLQVSKGIRFEWYFESGKTQIGRVEICRNNAADLTNQTICKTDAEYEVLSLAGRYSVAVPGFIASGGDSYVMLADGSAGQEQVPLHQSQYEVVLAYFRSKYFDLDGGGDGGDSGAFVIDLVAEHSYFGKTKACKGMLSVSQRVCQTDDVVQIPIGVFCGEAEGHEDVQECDQAYHMAEAINNKHDGFMDDLLPHARLVMRETHGIVPCSSGTARGAHDVMAEDASKMGLEHMFVATIGPGCSDDVRDVTEKAWRSESTNNRNNLVISGSSTASRLSDEDLYPNLARMSTPETSIGEGFAYLCKKYGWNRVAILHDSSTWGTDSAAKFEMAMLKDETVENELIYMDLGGWGGASGITGHNATDRTRCSEYNPEVDSTGRRKILAANDGTVLVFNGIGC